MAWNVYWSFRPSLETLTIFPLPDRKLRSTKHLNSIAYWFACVVRTAAEGAALPAATSSSVTDISEQIG